MTTTTNITNLPAAEEFCTRTATLNASLAATGTVPGQIAHAALGRLLEAGERRPSFAGIQDAVRAIVRDRRLSPTHRQMTTARACSAVHAYFLHFVPPPEWEFCGAEVPFAGCRADLVWYSPEHGFLFDEVKAGVWRNPIRTGAPAEQLQALLAAGDAAYQARFLGVRQLWLHAPHLCGFHRLDGGTNDPFLAEVSR